jgi:hypothetical protein
MEINLKSLSYEDKVQLLKQLIESFTDVKVTARCCEYEYVTSENINAVGENSVEIITNIFTG